MNARATRFPLFDSLRALAALSVFGTHAYFVLEANRAGPLRAYATRLDVGVYIFFVISGFLLYRPFVRARLGRQPRAPETKVYAWRRFLRIGPTYWVALTIVTIWLRMGNVIEPANAPWIYLFGQVYQPDLAIAGLPQAWSLCVEAAFYLFLPLYALALRKLPLESEDARFRAELAGLALLVVAGFGFSALAVENGAVAGGFEHFPLHLTLPCYLMVFAVGMWLALMSVRYEGRGMPRALRPLDRFPGIAWALAIVAFWAVSTQIGIDGHPGEQITTAQYLGRAALYAVVAFGVVVPAVFGDQTRGLVRRVLANRVLLFVGLVSYSLFLYHVAVVIQVDRWNLPAGPLVALVLSIAVAAASYYAVERPALKLKRFVGPKVEPEPREATAEPAPVAPPHVTQTS
jgi:peptidoglycan/LPS O-acetylase OafA/YrhL